MKLLNRDIYEYSLKLNKEFGNSNIKLPVKINFFLQKNIHKIMELGKEIEESKLNLGKEYGKYNKEKTAYDIPKENIEKVNKELNDLFSLEQDVDLHIFKLDDFDGIDLTYDQMDAIMFMIEE